MKTCKYCNTVQDSSYSFCSNCGAKLEDAQKEETPIVEEVNNVQPLEVNSTPNIQNKNSNNKLLPIIVVLFIVILAGVILGPIILNNSKKTTANNSTNNSNSNTNINTNESSKYSVGDGVTLVDGSKWHVINISGDNVTLLLDTLVVEKTGYSSKGGDEFHQKYENSDIKEYLEQTYLPSLKSSLESNGGNTTNLKVRLITAQEYLNVAGHELDSTKNQSKPSSNRTEAQKQNDNWLSMTNNYWTMTNIREIDPNHYNYGAYSVFVLLDSKLWADGDANDSSWYINNTAYGIRPVIETTTKNIK